MLAVYHPQIVHFAIALVVVGVLFRFVSLTGRLAFTGPVRADAPPAGNGCERRGGALGSRRARSGRARAGARDAVMEHEEWGVRARNVLLFVALVEVMALVLGRWGKARVAQVASALLCLPALFCIYEAGEHGGALVYSYAGGVGIRSGEPGDVERLLLAGLYHQAMRERQDGRTDEAAQLFGALAAHFPEDAAIQPLAVESLLLDRKDSEGARAALERIPAPTDDRLSLRYGLLKAEVVGAIGEPDAARAELESLARRFPNNRRVREQLDRGGD